MPKFIIELTVPEVWDKKFIYSLLTKGFNSLEQLKICHYYSIHLGDFDEYKVLSKKQIETLKEKGSLY